MWPLSLLVRPRSSKVAAQAGWHLLCRLGLPASEVFLINPRSKVPEALKGNLEINMPHMPGFELCRNIHFSQGCLARDRGQDLLQKELVPKAQVLNRIKMHVVC